VRFQIETLIAGGDQQLASGISGQSELLGMENAENADAHGMTLSAGEERDVEREQQE
jgi:hypothetical protein